MNDESTTNEKSSSGLGKLESLSQDELIKLVKNHILLKKKLEAKVNELTNSNTSLNQIEKELREEIDQNKINQSKFQEELYGTRQSLEDFRSKNEALEISCQNLRDEISNLQNELSIVRSSFINESQKLISHSELLTNSISTIIDLFQLPISLPESVDSEFINIYRNELEQKQENYKQIFEQFEQEKINLQQRIEDLEFFNEEIKLENDDLRLKSKTYQQDKHLMEKELDNYRRQIEDFEEQFLELQRENDQNHHETFDKSQQQPSTTSSLIAFDNNHDEISLQCINSILERIDDKNPSISKASSTSSLLLSTDIPTLLHSIGITNCTDDEFSVPLNFESVLRLSTLLIERCRVLQYILLKTNDTLPDYHSNNDCISFSQNNQFEQCKISIHKHDHIALDTLFERIYTAMNQTLTSNNWQIIIEKAIDQKISPTIRLEFDNFKFISNEIERDLFRLRTQYDQLTKENDNQRREISLLEKRLHSPNSYEQLKEHQTQLEEQLNKQIEKTIRLETILQKENIDITKFDQLKQIEISYHELQEKYHIAERLEEQLKELNRNYNEKILELKQQNELFEKLKFDYERQHIYLVERDENIRLLKIQLEEREQSERNLIENYQNQMKKIGNELEQQKLSLSNASLNQDQHFSSILKQQEELNQQYQTLNIDYEELQINYDQIKDEKNKLTNEIHLLKNRITILEKDNIENVDQTIREENEKLHQTINQLNEKIQTQNSENVQELKEKYQKMKNLLTRLKKELQEKNQQPKQSLIDLELADYDKTVQNLKEQLINKEKDLQDLRDELLNSTDKYACLKLEIKNLEQQKSQSDERANKFKALLDIAKRELQNAKDLEIQRYQNEDNVRSLIETLQNQLDNNKVLINQLNNEKQQLTEKLNNQSESTQKTMNLLEQNLRIAKHDLDIAKQDYDTLQDDFNSYKIRAQSVLKQHQSNQRERTPSLADKQIELEETIEKFKTNLQEANHKIQLLILENEALQKEQARLIEIQTKLINESRKREQDLRKQHQTEINQMKNEYLQRINDNQDTIKNITLQNETLSIAFKEQIATMESEHERAISNFQDQLQISEHEIEQLKIRIESLQQMNVDNEKLTDTTQIGIKNDSIRDNILAWNVCERQQGEGFGSANLVQQLPDSPIKISDNIQTDINSTIQNITTTNGEKLELQRQRSDDEFNQLKLRLINTTELLNESELNNQRLNEQVTLLKDEIRRIERNMDRAESISNLEYLKNVILKFFILKSIPERLQLIPVLVTMLKLSPEEQVQLVRVANIPIINDENLRSDESPSQQLTNGATSPSWSSYLNIW